MVFKVGDTTATATPEAARRQARRGAILLVIAAWNVWLWVTRIYNLVSDPGDTPAVGVHAVLYAVSLGLAAVLAVVGVRMRRESRASRDRAADA